MNKVLMAVLTLCFMAAAAGAAGKRVTVDVGDRPFLGPADASVTVIEFLDFQ